MSVPAQADLFLAEWHPPTGRQACNRDTKAGPGTCWHWWDGCSKPEKRGCYQLWRRLQRHAAEGTAS